jgi:hypothetical protein
MTTFTFFFSVIIHGYSFLQNWVSVSRTMKQFGEPGRPPDWFSQKNCALQVSTFMLSKRIEE